MCYSTTLDLIPVHEGGAGPSTDTRGSELPGHVPLGMVSRQVPTPSNELAWLGPEEPQPCPAWGNRDAARHPAGVLTDRQLQVVAMLACTQPTVDTPAWNPLARWRGRLVAAAEGRELGQLPLKEIHGLHSPAAQLLTQVVATWHLEAVAGSLKALVDLLQSAAAVGPLPRLVTAAAAGHPIGQLATV
ncbi:UNVERIFIED_CONTAM: hypothetical protein K2H54_014826 [Gekko kuhli]